MHIVTRCPSGATSGPDDVVTWHHGLIAKWWALFNLDGPEIEFFRPFVEAGQPALDAACGTGRLLVPWVAAGLDVDGVDASADMIAGCREAAQRVGRNPTLYVQPLHRLELPRRYGAIVLCGGFGLGATREQDLEGLHRLFAHLRPGGVLALDYEVGEFDAERLRELAAEGGRRLAAGAAGSAPRQRRLRVRAPAPHRRRRPRRPAIVPRAAGVAVVRREARRPRDPPPRHQRLFLGRDHRRARRRRIRRRQVVGGYHGGPPTGDERFLVYLAHRPV